MDGIAEKPERISEIYRRIFSSDPLLIDPKSQSDYSKALLKHVLLNRSMGAGRNRRIDLLREQDTDRFLNRAISRPQKPSDDLKQRYFGTRTARTEVPKEDFDVLRRITMVARGDLTSDRTGPKFTEHSAAEADLPPANVGSPIQNRLRIATIGYRVKISRA